MPGLGIVLGKGISLLGPVLLASLSRCHHRLLHGLHLDLVPSLALVYCVILSHHALMPYSRWALLNLTSLSEATS